MKPMPLITLLAISSFGYGCVSSQKDDHSYKYVYQHIVNEQVPQDRVDPADSMSGGSGFYDGLQISDASNVLRFTRPEGSVNFSTNETLSTDPVYAPRSENMVSGYTNGLPSSVPSAVWPVGMASMSYARRAWDGQTSPVVNPRVGCISNHAPPAKRVMQDSRGFVLGYVPSAQPRQCVQPRYYSPSVPRSPASTGSNGTGARRSSGPFYSSSGSGQRVAISR